MILDTNPAHVSAQPENAVILPKWTGDKDDKELVSLIPFLEYVAALEYDDVRKVLKSFEGKHIPTEFARREAIARAEFEKQRGIKSKTKSKPGVGLLGSLLGLKTSNMSMVVVPEGEQNPTEAIAEGKMLHDIARDRGRRYMEALERDIRENGERYLKEQKEAMDKQQKEAMNDMMGGFAGMFIPGEKDMEKGGKTEKKAEEAKVATEAKEAKE
jgi:mitochondrial import inner membrane translocase subunit TIM50